MGCGSSNPRDVQQPVRKEVKSIDQFNLTAQDLVQEKYGKITKDYVLLNPPIGKGAYGEVRKGLHRVTEAIRAIKIISKQHTSKEEHERLKTEVEILRKLDHPNIIKVYEFYQDQRYFYIVTELCTGGELFDKITEEKHFSEQKAALTMRQVLSAVYYCHKNGVVHRDLKPENVLYESNKPNSILKVVDFGTSKIMDPNQKMSQKLGTPYYIAPEVLDRNYDEKCDIWSCGVILYILLCGYPPFSGANERIIMEKVKVGKYSIEGEEWNMISSEAKVMLSKMLQKDVNRRYSAEQALQDPWIIKYAQQQPIDLPSLTRALNNMKSFRADKKLQEATWIFIVNQLATKEEKNELLKTFQALDLNNDGMLSREELLLGYSKIMPYQEAEEEVERIMQTIDKNHSNSIDYTEFVMATINRERLLQKERLETAFKMFDTDKSGKISTEEIKQLLGGSSSVDKKVWEELINEVDENGDGEVFQHFKHILDFFRGVQGYDAQDYVIVNILSFFFTSMLATMDAKGQQALQVLQDLQKKVLSSEAERVTTLYQKIQDYKPSQTELSKINLVVFRARVHNQQQLNDWFIQSVTQVVEDMVKDFLPLKVYHIFNQCQTRDHLLSRCVKIFNTIVRYIYYSAVFIIDAKESNSLFTLGIQCLKDKLIQPILQDIRDVILDTTRSLPLTASKQQIESNLYDSRRVLEVLRACGWTNVTIKQERGQLSLKQMGTDADNQYFRENFEKLYVNLIKQVVAKYSHKPPLDPLTAQIDHEHQLLQYLIPDSLEYIMNEAEGECILKVVHELEQSLSEMIDKNQDEAIQGVVDLFDKVNSKQNEQQIEKFSPGQQFQKPQLNLTTFPLKPFKILGQMFRKFLITHKPDVTNITHILEYINKYTLYIEKIFKNQHDIKLAFDYALEIILNLDEITKDNLIQEILQSQNAKQSEELIKLINYMQKPRLITEYGIAVINKLGKSLHPLSKKIDLDLEIMKLDFMRNIYSNQSPDWFRLSELIQVVEKFKTQNQDQQLTIIPPSFCRNHFNFFRVKSLPKSLQNLISESEEILLDYGYAVSEFQGYTLVVNNYQLITLSLISEGSNSLSQIKKLFEGQPEEFDFSLSALLQSGLILKEGDGLKFNDCWCGKKQTVIFTQ